MSGDALFVIPSPPLVEMPPEAPPASPPLVEMPPEAPPASPPLEVVPPPSPEGNLALDVAPPPFLPPAVPPPAAALGPAYAPTLTYVAPEPLPALVLSPTLGPPPEEPGPSPAGGLPAGAATEPPPEGGTELLAGPAPQPLVAASTAQPEAETDLLVGVSPPVRAPRPARGGLFIPVLLIFLIPYSLFTTVALVMLWMKKQGPSLEVLPDPEPDKDHGGPARRKNGQRVRNNLPLPVNLRGKFHVPIRVGDLEVIPQRVERQKDHALVLTLKMVNRSADVEFNPVCQAFNKHNPKIPAEPKPYTFLDIAPGNHIYGGQWETTRADQPFDGRLEPGGGMVATLTTAPLDAEQRKALQNATGTLLWRVQVRRGFVQFRGRDVSATAVVGVEFPAQALQLAPNDQARRPVPGKPGVAFALRGRGFAGKPVIFCSFAPPFSLEMPPARNVLLLGQQKSHCQSPRAIYN
jgi:hypothetical protein